MGDGTLSWESTGGAAGGYIKISDWANGDWHWASAPDVWQGDWSNLIGENLEFYFKTNHPSYGAIIELHTIAAKRFEIQTDSFNLSAGSNTRVRVIVIPPPSGDVAVSLSSSNTGIISVPTIVTIPAGTNSAEFTAEANSNVVEESKAVITASASDYDPARITISVDPAGVPRFTLALSKIGNGTVSSSLPGIDCGSDCDERYPAGTLVTLMAAPEPGWQFRGWGGACTGTADCTLTIEGPTEVTANFTELSNRYQLDSPVNGGFESGIGVVQGWVCEADQVSVQVDDRVPFATAYGAERADSLEVCGDTVNGFAAAINWSEYGDGAHTLTLLADGQPLTEARVTVTTLGESFLAGLSATTTVSDFPAPGLETPLAWSEPHQNFAVSTASAAAADALFTPLATIQGHWESPLAGGVESGQALIRGWVCAADTLSAELDGEPLTLPYGSERDDTQAVCGDTDNGYALAINWADYRDGPHQIRLLLDDVPVETRAFQIATPGGQGTVSSVQRQHPVSDFPNPGDQLTLQWSEPHQNFRIIAYAAATGPTPQSYHRKVRAYFHGVLGRAPEAEELDAWSTVLFDNAGSVWKPTGAGLQPHVSDLAGLGTDTPTPDAARALVDTTLTHLFGTTNGLDPNIADYYIAHLLDGGVRPRGLVNALINDLGLMPKVDGTHGQPNGWSGGPGTGLLTQTQIDAYRVLIQIED